MDSVPGLYYFPDAVSEGDDAEGILKALDAGTWTPVAGVGSQKVQQYGYRYNYRSRKAVEEVEEPPPALRALRGAAEGLLSTAGVAEIPVLNQIIVNRYEPGEGILAHVDKSEFGPVVACFSFGSPISITFQSPSGASSELRVEPLSCYAMTGDARYLWTHEIRKRKSDVVKPSSRRVPRGERISVTFRSVMGRE